MKYKHGLVIMLIIANIALSAFSIYQEQNNYGLCLTGQGCEAVQNSAYNSIFGIKLGWFGIFTFLALLAIFEMHRRNHITKEIPLIMALAGAMFSSYFIYLQLYVIKSICSTCMAIDALMIVIFSILLHDYLKMVHN